MQARIYNINRPRERLIGTRELAERLGIGYDAAMAFLRRYGVCPSGKKGGRWYITEAKLHAVLMR